LREFIRGIPLPFGGANTVTDIKLVATDNTPATTALRRDDRQLEDRWNLPASGNYTQFRISEKTFLL
jgi:hypothetical protein